MTGEMAPEQKIPFGKRFRSLEKQVAELRECLNLPPAASAAEPDRSVMFLIADITEREEPDPARETYLGCVLHMTTDPRIAHELFRMESALAPGQIGMYAYRHLETAELRTVCDPSDLVAQVLLYFSQDELHRPITIKSPLRIPPNPSMTSQNPNTQGVTAR